MARAETVHAGRDVARVVSIRRTLLLYLGALFALGALVLVFAARDYGRGAADRAYDHLLVSSALSIAGTVALVGGEWEVDLPYAALELLGMAPEDRVFYRVSTRAGHTITGYDDLPPPPKPPQAEAAPTVFDARYSGEPVRFVVVARRVAAASGQGEVLVQVGQTRLAREALAQALVVRALLAIALLSIVAMALVWFGVHRALRPLARIERDLSQRDPADLRPLVAGAPRELDHVVAALNRFMARLSSSNATLRAFMAEAAHQMRTPLAAMRAQAQAGLDEETTDDMRHSLVAIERNATHMSRLLNQMLSDASAIHRTQLQAFESVDLAEVVHQSLHDALPAFGPRPQVQLAIASGPALVRGDPLLLREALKNIIDNACKYGDGAPLHVALTADGDAWAITVADRGPGIAPADAERVFERFVRGGQAPAGGAGLGLAIVRRIVDAHGGRVELVNRVDGGLVVTLHLPGHAP